MLCWALTGITESFLTERSRVQESQKCPERSDVVGEAAAAAAQRHKWQNLMMIPKCHKFETFLAFLLLERAGKEEK